MHIGRSRHGRPVKLDNFDRAALRRTVYYLYNEGIIPNLRNIAERRATDNPDKKVCHRTIWKYLKILKFGYVMSKT